MFGCVVWMTIMDSEAVLCHWHELVLHNDALCRPVCPHTATQPNIHIATKSAKNFTMSPTLIGDVLALVPLGLLMRMSEQLDF